jgi:hypothetical protein
VGFVDIVVISLIRDGVDTTRKTET